MIAVDSDFMRGQGYYTSVQKQDSTVSHDYRDGPTNDYCHVSVAMGVNRMVIKHGCMANSPIDEAIQREQ